MAYAARMSLEADSLTERLFYCAMAEDEARHFYSLHQYIEKQSIQCSEDDFSHWLETAIKDLEKPLLVFLVQVLLEGWGLQHYYDLARYCQTPELTRSLFDILRDEGSHHGGGVQVFNGIQLQPNQESRLTEILAGFFEMVRLGPQRVLAGLDQIHGGMTLKQKLEFWSQVEAERTSTEKLQALKRLMQKCPQTWRVVETLEEGGCFKPLPARVCLGGVQ